MTNKMVIYVINLLNSNIFPVGVNRARPEIDGQVQNTHNKQNQIGNQLQKNNIYTWTK